MTSIRRRLLMSLLGGLVLCTALMGWIAYINSSSELNELLTANLRRIAVVVHARAHGASTPDTRPAVENEEPEESYVIQQWDRQGRLLQSSSPQIALPLQTASGLTQAMIDGTAWQIYQLKSDDGAVQVAQPSEIVATMVGESAGGSLLPFLILFILLSGGAYYVVGQSLKPLAVLSRAIAAQDATRLESLPLGNAPRELKPVVCALNDLVARLDQALSLQRQFTADAAHELRTPLTAIKLQLDLVMRAGSQAERDEALHKLSSGIDRSIRLATQLLSSSRSMAVPSREAFQDVDLSALILSCVRTFIPMARDRDIQIEAMVAKSVRVEGDAEALQTLTNNLIDNAVRYSPVHGQVEATLALQDGNAVLEVSDNGLGIKDSERDHIFRRFYRSPGTTSTGSGLGLSIVRAIAETHGATVEVDTAAGRSGAKFRVIFPMRKSAPAGRDA